MNKTIRIAQIMGKWVGGGVENVVMNYYSNIDHSKIQFDFICDEDSTNIPYEKIKNMGGNIILVPPYQNVFKYQKKLIQIFKKNKYNIVHSHINALSFFSLRAAKKANVPIRIAHSHSTTNKREWKKNLLKNLLRPFSKVYATHYMCCSEIAGRWLFGNKTYDKGEVILINNAIDIYKFAYDEKKRYSKRLELNIKEDTLVIGHVGRFVKQKNHDFLIEVFKYIHNENKNSILLLIGQGPLKDEIKEKVKKFGLSENVKFLGQREDVDELYQAMDLFLFPSLYEGLGMVIIEAQVSGLSCVCSTEVPNVVKINKNIEFVSLNDSLEEWNKKILDVLKTEKRMNYFKSIDNSGYNIKIEAKKLQDTYMKWNEIYE